MSEPVSRVERLLNLLALLLDTPRPLARDDIVRKVAGYPPERSAYRRAFERDKEALRALGVPITVVPIETGEPGEVGYRVPPDDYYLPDLDLTPDETAALRIAVSAVSLGTGAAQGALMKLGGLTGGAPPPIASLPLAPALAPLFEAYRRRAVVQFAYRGETREVEPWALTARRGNWYVVGFDRKRGAVRSFRADRIEGDVRAGAGGSFAVPDDFDPDAHLEDRPWLFGDAPPTTARVLVDADHVAGAEAAIGPDATWERRPDGSAVVTMPVVDTQAFRTFVLGFLEHAEVLEPPSLRDEIVRWLTATAGSP